MPKRKHYHYNNKKKKYLYLILKIICFFVFISILSVFSLFIYYTKDFPRPEKFTEKPFVLPTKIYDRTGEILLYEVYGEEKREIVPLEKIPESLKMAVIATEDANFYRHIGLDFKGILRAIISDLKLGRPAEGASTISQQLIRSTFLTRKKTLERKIREIVLTLEIERRYSKDQILEFYLNQIPFGGNAYGVEEASQIYFKKSVSDISIPESVILAALIRGPSYYSPYKEKSKKRLLNRKNYVLSQMVKRGYITAKNAKEEQEKKIVFAEKKIEIKAPYFTLWVQQELKKQYGESFLKEKGLTVYTTLDWDLQQIAEKTVKEGIQQNKKYNANNAGLTAIDPKTGEVLAMTVGTGNYYEQPYPSGCVSGKDCSFDPKFNIVTNGKRQPGSAIKPFIYATAFERGYDDNTIVIDEETNFGIWGGKEYIPRNYDGKFRGSVTLRQALAQSLNIPSMKVLLNLTGSTQSQGLKNSVNTARKMGITTINPPYYPSIVLGGKEVNLLEITSAYGVFATNGLKAPPINILKITNSSGNIIKENKNTLKRVLNIKQCCLINDILSDNEARSGMFGTRSSLYFEKYDVAVKTGTTDSYKDAWAIGYTPFISVGVWCGNNNNESMAKKPSVVLSGKIFHNFLEKVLLKHKKEYFKKPIIE
ncbi:MAG: PBP1A family penicillin-binding protein [Patescibacteria group bacterium]|nr:PBP1A family penicillin-binding protein [Patescibacteria group bacterium]